MNIFFDNLKIGQSYDRVYLAELWGYKDFHAIARGIISPKDTNYLILFITKEKQAVLTQYNNSLYLGLLKIEGETNHANDDRIINSKNKYNIQLFYREKHHTDFLYYGQIFLKYYKHNLKEPSKFSFTVPSDLPDDKLLTEMETHGQEIDPNENNLIDGKEKLITHIIYERNKINRERAIEIHGTTCAVCGFNFNEFYGEELAKDYIEIHHLILVSTGEYIVNPKTDLVPLCSNCHSMAHRKKDTIITIEELRKYIREK